MSIARRARGAALRPHPDPHRSPRRARDRVSSRRSRRSAKWAATPNRSPRSRRCSIAANGGRRSGPRGCVPRRRRRCAHCGSPAAQQALDRGRGRRIPGGVRRAAKAALDRTGDRAGRREGAADGRWSLAHCRRRRAASRRGRPRRAAVQAGPPARRQRRSMRSSEAVVQLLADQPSVAIGFIDQEIVVGDTPLPRAAENYGELIRRLQAVGVERIAFERGVTPEELARSCSRSPIPSCKPGDTAVGVAAVRSPRRRCSRCRTSSVGRINLDERVDTSAADVATIRRLYSDAVNIASSLWDAAQERRAARSGWRPRARRQSRTGGRAEPHGARRADRAQGLRQLHVHAHGERVDPDDGPGARAGRRGARCCASSGSRR